VINSHLVLFSGCYMEYLPSEKGRRKQKLFLCFYGYYAVEEKIDAFLTKIELEDINNDCNASWLQMAGSEITYLKNHLKRVIT